MSFATRVASAADLAWVGRVVHCPKLAQSVKSLVLVARAEGEYAEDLLVGDLLLEILSRVQLQRLEVRIPWDSSVNESAIVQAVADTQAESLRVLAWNTHAYSAPDEALSQWLGLRKLESFELCGHNDVFDPAVGSVISRLRVRSLVLSNPVADLVIQPWLERFVARGYLYDGPWFAGWFAGGWVDAVPRFSLRVLDVAGVPSPSLFDSLHILVSACPDLEELNFTDRAGPAPCRRVLESVLGHCPKFKRLEVHSCDDPRLNACALFVDLDWRSPVVALHRCVVDSMYALRTMLAEVHEVVLVDCLVDVHAPTRMTLVALNSTPM
jgi:hypothetical protein